jgi:hypothetical protein
MDLGQEKFFQTFMDEFLRINLNCIRLLNFFLAAAGRSLHANITINSLSIDSALAN